MSNPNFKTIAILDTRAINSAINGDDEGLISTVRDWEFKALERGMEACYLRLYNLEPQKLEIVISGLSPSTRILVPYSVNWFPERVSGVHFRENEPIKTCERNTQALWRGKSCHSLESIHEAEQENLNYVFFSPVFNTATHPEVKGVGLEKLKQVCDSTKIPVFALGGITQENYKQCLDAGAFGIAAIGMFMEDFCQRYHG